MRGNKIMGMIWFIIAVLLGLLLILKLRDSKSYGNDKLRISFNSDAFEDANLYDTMNFSVDEINDIDINLSNCSVKVESTTDSKISVELYCSENSAPSVSVIKNVLKIEEQKNLHLFSTESRKIVVKLPENFESNEIEIKTASGSIRCSNIKTPVMDCNTASGSMHFDGCKIDSLDLKSASGSIHMNAGEINELECATTSGSIHLNGKIDKADVRGISGSIHATLTEPLKFDSEFQTTSGSINLEVPKESNMKIQYSVVSGSYKNDYTGTSGKKGTDIMGNGSPNVELKTTSGSIKVR